ncbi:MAG: cytochrome c oxidase assembly protein [Xanthobacteraceae bacterium]
MPAVASGLAVLAAGGLALLFPMEPISAHMLLHIALMNVAAPLIAGVLAAGARLPTDRAALVWAATIAQLLLLWFWHAPPAHRLATGSMWMSFAMHGSLFAVALLFWLSLITLTVRNSWQAIFALLLTGKLACLLGVVLIFAPRALYQAGHADGHGAQSLLDDQQLAGLYMITACPLSYLLAGVIIAAHAMTYLGRRAPALAKYTT